MAVRDRSRRAGDGRVPRSRGATLVTIVAALLATLAPASAAAHARWFTEEGPFAAPEWGRLVSLPVGLALASGAAAVAFLAWLQRSLDDPLWPRPPIFQRLETSAPAILGVQAAITMIFMASRLALFVPNITLPRNALGVLIAAVTVTAAFSFITGVLTRVGALVTIGVVIVALAVAPWYEVLEQAIFVGIALYLFAVGRGVVRYDGEEEDAGHPWAAALRPHALTILRVATGISVLTLAFTEKLVNNDLGVAFLQNYPNFNVGRDVGIAWFTDERFVYAIGIIEATAGIALLAGFLPRLVILALWIPFNLGIAFLPAEELIGHLPILSTMYVLLVRGTEGIPPPAAEPARAAEPYPAQRASAGVGG